MPHIFRESDIVKKTQQSSFKFTPMAAAIAMALSSQFAATVAHAGSGFGSGVNLINQPVAVPTYYANSPAGPGAAMDTSKGGATATIDQVTGLPFVNGTGKALRKFVDTLPGIPGMTPANLGGAPFGVNNLGQYIPLAVPEKWVDGSGVATSDDYYEIAAVEFTEKMHSDLVKATHLRGYVQLSTATNPGKHIALSYPNGSPIKDAAGAQVYAYDNPHHLGPVINSSKGTAVRVKFSNYLPVGGKLFIPVDTTITGAGFGPDGKTLYTQNRAEIHLVGGQSPWISAGSPHQWVAPAGEAAAYAAGMGKGVSAQNVPDMADPGLGASTLYFPNNMSARFMFYQDRTSGLTRLNSYAGLEAGYFVTDSAEQALVASGAIPSDQIPLIIEDKTFVPANITQQDSKWTDANWGKPGDLWFPHVYETNQDTNSVNGTNPVGRWDYGPLFWPIFPVVAAKVTLPTPSFTPEAYLDTPLINGTAYPTLTVDPKAYRLRILNASNDRYINLGFYKADASVSAPLLDQNGNPMFDASGKQLLMTGTEVKMVPAVGDAAGNPVNWDVVNGVQLPLPQYPGLRTNINAEPSGPSRAWPVDGRPGGAPDPTTAGPDFIVIGNDGGLLPTPVDVPAQPVTYEANRRSITVGNIYGYGMLLGPAERADTIVDFSQYAGQTLILYNDAPAPTPFNDVRNDYYTGGPDLTASGGAYTTQPGYGPNTRTMMQIRVLDTAPAAAYDTALLANALPATYGASQPHPIVPSTAYNAAFGTNDTDIYAHVATGSAAQPTLDFATAVNGVVTLTGLKLVTSGGTVGAGGAVGANATPGSGTGYDPLSPPVIKFNNTVNSVACLNPATGVSGSATAVVDAVTKQVTTITDFKPGTDYTCAPVITFVPTSPISNLVAVTNGGSGYAVPPKVTISGGGGKNAAAQAIVSYSLANMFVMGGSGYTAPTVSVSGGGLPAGTVTGTATVGTSAATLALTPGTGYSTPTVTVSGGGVAAGSVTGKATVGTSAATLALTPGAGYTAPIVTVSGGGVPAGTVNGSASVGTSAATVSVTPGSGYANPVVSFTGVGAGGIAVTGTGSATVGTSGALVSVSGGANYTAPSVSVSGGGVAAGSVTGSATVGTSSASITVAGGSNYSTNPSVSVSGGGVSGVTGIAIVDVNGVITDVQLTPNAGFTSAPTITITDSTGTGASATASVSALAGTITGVTLTPSAGFTSAPVIGISDATGTGASATASVSSPAGTITGITLPATALFVSAPSVSITEASASGAVATASVSPEAGTITAVSLTPNLGFTSAPIVTVAQGGNTSAKVTATVDTTAGTVLAISLTPNAGFKSAPVITITDPNVAATGASAIASVLPIAGTVTAVVLTPSNTLYTIAPTIGITDATGSNASATATLAPTGTVTAVAVTNRGTGFTDTPSMAIVDNVGSGTGATAVAILSTPTGVGAQATVTAVNSFAFPVLTKAEQELFDDYGRYNSTGGIELPMTNGVIQTTVPLNYIDSPTEFIAEGDVQLWKLVDNGFWSNSMHFDMVDVQLINRVGWDGTVKAPATNELGWKDTVRLNPLEDVIVAMRAKSAPMVFGLPASSRLKDPSKALNAAVGSGLGFTNAAAVVDAAGKPLLTTTNGLTSYDNEFTWGSAVLGHSENDFTRPVVYHPTVAKPDAPTNLGGSGGVLTWSDPTPSTLASTVANPKNEVGFKVLRASYSAANVLGAYSTLAAPTGSTPANATGFTDATKTPGAAYSYEVVAWNSAGATASAPYIELTAPAVPTWNGAFGLPSPANGAVTLKWNTVTGATGYVVTANGAALPVIAAAAGATQTAVLNLPLGVNYTSITVQAQQARLALVANSTASTSLQADLTLPAAPAAPVLKATTITPAGVPTLGWTAIAGATGYLVSVNGGTPVPAAGTSYTFPTPPAAGSLVPGFTYAVTVAAQTTKFGQVIPSTLTSTSIDLTAPGVPATPAGLAATVTATTGAAHLTWTAATAVTGTTFSYRVSITDAVGTVAVVPVTAAVLNPTALQMPLNGSYSVSVQTVATRFGLSTVSLASTSIPVDLTAAVAPVAPVSLTATTTRLTWVAATGVSANATVTYAIQQSVDGGVNWTAITGSPFGYTSPMSYTSASGNNYLYRVQALATRYGLATAASAWTISPVLNTVPAASSTPVGAVGAAAGQISVSWTNGSSNITSWTVQRKLGTANAVTVAPASLVQNGTGYSFTDTGLTKGGSYTYRVTATSAGGANTATVYSTAVIAP